MTADQQWKTGMWAAILMAAAGSFLWCSCATTNSSDGPDAFVHSPGPDADNTFPDSTVPPDGSAGPDGSDEPDSGTEPDGGGLPDGGPLPDAGPLPDGSILPDGGSNCPNPCGDVDQNGTVDATDYGVLSNIVNNAITPTPCELHGGDLKRDGMLTPADMGLLDQYLAGNVTTGICLPCTFQCGDVNGDGNLDISDVVVIGQISVSPPWDACQFWRSDVDGDLRITADSNPPNDTDGEYLMDHLFGSGSLSCNP